MKIKKKKKIYINVKEKEKTQLYVESEMKWKNSIFIQELYIFLWREKIVYNFFKLVIDCCKNILQNEHHTIDNE